MLSKKHDCPSMSYRTHVQLCPSRTYVQLCQGEYTSNYVQGHLSNYIIWDIPKILCDIPKCGRSPHGDTSSLLFRETWVPGTIVFFYVRKQRVIAYTVTNDFLTILWVLRHYLTDVAIWHHHIKYCTNDIAYIDTQQHTVH